MILWHIMELFYLIMYRCVVVLIHIFLADIAESQINPTVAKAFLYDYGLVLRVKIYDVFKFFSGVLTAVHTGIGEVDQRCRTVALSTDVEITTGSPE